MSALEDDALTVLLVKVVRDRLALLDEAARDRLKAALRPGARHIVGLPGDEVEVGGITRTKPAAPKALPAVADAGALLEWVRLAHPTEVWFPPAPHEEVRPAFRTWLLAAVAKGEEVWADPVTGDVLEAPPGVTWLAPRQGTSTLQVRATPEGDAALLAAMRNGSLALPWVLDGIPVAVEGGPDV